MVKLEICCADFHSLLAAYEGGADRVELCCALSEGGLTPSHAFLELAAEVPIRKHILIRPRTGDFVYSKEEIRLMEHDIRFAHKAGADAIVVGALKNDGNVDKEAMRRLIDAADGLPITFHRAFDVCSCINSAVDAVVELGCASVLTSGMMPSAEEGERVLSMFQKIAGDRFEVIAAAGISPKNVERIIRNTGVRAVHASASMIVPNSKTLPGLCKLEGSTAVREESRRTTSLETVKELRRIISTL